MSALKDLSEKVKLLAASVTSTIRRLLTINSLGINYKNTKPVIAFLLVSMMLLVPLAVLAQEGGYRVNLSAEPSSGGTVIVSGDGAYEADESVTITATPSEDYKFVNWTGANDVVITDASYTFEMPGEDVTLVANFERITYELNLSASSGGTVSGGGAYEADESVTITATPAEGYNFVNWTGDMQSNNQEFSFEMPANNVNLVANFEEVIETEEEDEEEMTLMQVLLYDLTIATNPSGSGSASGAGSYEEGKPVNIIASPNQFYTFSNWTAPAGIFDDATDPDTTFTMPNDNVEVTANFISFYDACNGPTSTVEVVGNTGTAYHMHYGDNMVRFTGAATGTTIGGIILYALIPASFEGLTGPIPGFEEAYLFGAAACLPGVAAGVYLAWLNRVRNISKRSQVN